MGDTFTFKRYELKFLVTGEQKEKLIKLIDDHMVSDKHGRSTISNIYYDRDDYLLIRRSLNKDIYKEKLRLRSYGRPNENSKVFLEIKKKYKGIVYKRRISMTEEEACRFLEGKYMPESTQIEREIEYFRNVYKPLAPKMYISYEREAYFGKEDPDFRLTFDENILWRNTDLNLCGENYGNELLTPGLSVMEIKVRTGIPLWLTKFLTTEKIYKTSFSKYGRAYEELMKRKKENSYVA